MNESVLHCNATSQHLPRPLSTTAPRRKKGLTMTVLDYLPVGLAVLAVVARVAMFLPRQPKTPRQAA